MKNLETIVFIFIVTFNSAVFAQVGIGTVTPEQSSVLDVTSIDKGILLPRLTTLQRDAISSPSDGLLLYNVSTSNFNYFNTNWKDFSPSYKSVNSSVTIETQSAVDINIPGMTLSPSHGVHSVSFESEILNTNTPSPYFINSNMLLTDFYALYNQVMAFSPINTHSATYGSDETIIPGRYDVASAISIVGNIILDGQGNPNSIFIFHSGGALSFSANATVILTNGASAENIFWLGEGAIGVGASSIIYGNLISHGAAVAVGANCSVTGRLLTNTGAVSFGPGICSIPVNNSLVINYGTLSTIVLFTGSGAISNTGNSVYNGNICSGAGDTSSLSVAKVNGIIIPPTQNTNINGYEAQSFVATFSMYQNNILISGSTKQITCNSGYTNISLSGIASINDGEFITIKWKTNTGTLTLGNRVFTSIKVQ